MRLSTGKDSWRDVAAKRERASENKFQRSDARLQWVGYICYCYSNVFGMLCAYSIRNGSRNGSFPSISLLWQSAVGCTIFIRFHHLFGWQMKLKRIESKIWKVNFHRHACHRRRHAFWIRKRQRIAAKISVPSQKISKIIYASRRQRYPSMKCVRSPLLEF